MYYMAYIGGAVKGAPQSNADFIREHAVEEYVVPARQQRDRTFSINVGEIHRALGLNNLVPSVCSALGSRKFLMENQLRLISKSGPPSGKSTTVTYTYEFIEAGPASPKEDPWGRLRGALKDVFAELGGGEQYLRAERENFYGSRQSK
jgi:hypothetical protein